MFKTYIIWYGCNDQNITYLKKYVDKINKRKHPLYRGNYFNTIALGFCIK